MVRTVLGSSRSCDSLRRLGSGPCRSRKTLSSTVASGNWFATSYYYYCTDNNYTGTRTNPTDILLLLPDAGGKASPNPAYQLTPPVFSVLDVLYQSLPLFLFPLSSLSHSLSL